MNAWSGSAVKAGKLPFDHDPSSFWWSASQWSPRSIAALISFAREVWMVPGGCSDEVSSATPDSALIPMETAEKTAARVIAAVRAFGIVRSFIALLRTLYCSWSKGKCYMAG